MNYQENIGQYQTTRAGLRNRLRTSSVRDFKPSNLLNVLIAHLDLKNDAALARALDIAPPQISKLRHLTLPVSAAILIRMHDVSGISIRDLRRLMGDERRRFGVSDE